MKTEEQRLFDDLYDVESRKSRNDEYVFNRQTKIKTPSKPTNYPDAKKHQLVSFIKSAVRILGYVALPIDIGLAAGILIFSEIVGIIEELV